MTEKDLRNILIQKNYEIEIGENFFLAEPVDDTPDKNTIFEVYELLDDYFVHSGLFITRNKDGIITGSTNRNGKALDGIVSEIDIHLKSLDDAISDQGKLFSNIIQATDKFLRDFDRVIAKLEDGPEMDINLSDNSPFKKLTKKELRNKMSVDKVWNELPRFMYFKEELDIFEKEYNAILDAIPNLEKNFLIKSLKGTLGFLSKLPEDARVNEDTESVKKFASRIKKAFASTQVQVNYNIDSLLMLKTLNELIEEIKKVIAALSV